MSHFRKILYISRVEVNVKPIKPMMFNSMIFRMDTRSFANGKRPGSESGSFMSTWRAATSPLKREVKHFVSTYPYLSQIGVASMFISGNVAFGIMAGFLMLIYFL